MPSEHIQWFPGHMAKTRRLITENLKNVHIIIEVLDARVPVSSRNPELRKMTGDKPTILLLNKASLADPKKSKEFVRLYTDTHTVCILCDCVTGEGLNRLPEAIRTVLKDRVDRYEEKGQAGRHLRAMVVGVPNVGKSTLINRMSGGVKAKTENRPGVTRNKQWVSTKIGIDLLDMPGVLWPKFEDQIIGENLAVTGAIRDDILDIEHLAIKLVGRLRELYPNELATRFKLTDTDKWQELSDMELISRIGKKRGCLIPGGVVDNERVSNLLIDEFRAGKIGRLTIDKLPGSKKAAVEPVKSAETSPIIADKLFTDTPEASKKEGNTNALL
ncbi:MAG: ribosome biogenesis GTPase YlqF [Oscillospiraceae bacterium]|nr:ribosome biogenesis GTPase YlqF [Clostridia bacterium]MBP3698407.1 ribosome biogenesis GTPase YlqF [Oscillospiraceae bacterium]